MTNTVEGSHESRGDAVTLPGIRRVLCSECPFWFEVALTGMGSFDYAGRFASESSRCAQDDRSAVNDSYLHSLADSEWKSPGNGLQ